MKIQAKGLEKTFLNINASGIIFGIILQSND